MRAYGFFFYDEGLYLNHNRLLLEYINTHTFSPSDFWQILNYYFKSALGSGKALWYFVIDLRCLWGGVADWKFSKVAACFFALMTFPVVFVFTRRFYNSTVVALISLVFLAILPGHVFYSRLGLQEALSTLLVVAGFYFYLYPRQFGWKTALSATLFAAAFFANYRLIMLPVLVTVTEAWVGLVEKKGIDWRKYTWCLVVFFAWVVLVGALENGANTYMVFAWVFHQENLAHEVFSWVNFFSYPYYLFRIENFILALLFFGNVYLLVKKQWNVVLPFLLVCVQMAVFSTTNEKGARYICVMLPFVVMSVAYLIKYLYDQFDLKKRGVLIALVAIMCFMMSVQSFQIAMGKSSYEKAATYILAQDPNAKFLSSQDLVLNLYVTPRDRVQPLPQNFELLEQAYKKGYRYLVLGPQSYVDFPAGQRFTLPLKDYLGFIDAQFVPIRTFPHVNKAIMERFVFEHSVNLVGSIQFLSSKDIGRMFTLRIYDLSKIVPVMDRIVQQMSKKK
nr:hypothetical protein JG1_0090 [uncultured bacterium]